MTDIRAQLLAAFEVEHRDHLEVIRRALGAPEAADMREVFRRAHSLKGAARAVDLPDIEEMAHGLEGLFARVIEGEATLDAAAIDATHRALDAIEARAARVRDPGAPPDPPVSATSTRSRPVGPAPPRASRQRRSPEEPEPPAAEVGPDPDPAPATEEAGADRTLEYLRVEGAAITALTQTLHQLTAEVQSQESAPQFARRLEGEALRLEQLWSGLRFHAGGGRETAPVRAFEQALKELRNDLGDLARRQARSSWSLEQGVAGLRDQIEQIALTPAENLFGDLGRMVRDLARDAGLEVDVRVDGLEVQAERRVLQALRDPVIHLLRNAVSHGAEPAAARARAGKPERMRIGLELTTRAGRLRVRVYDDGRGPDLARIEAVAIRKGLLAPRAPGEPPPTPEELLSLAFEPGLSATEAVDRLSGRGMGLSIVVEAVRALGGSVRLAARRPAGAEVLISAPVTTARQSVVLAQAGTALYALPTFGVGRLLRIPVGALESVEGAPTTKVTVEGSEVVTPVTALASLIANAPVELPAADGFVSAVLVSRGERHIALAVDAVRDVRELLVETLEASVLDAQITLGAVLLEDGAAAVLNPDGLLDRWLRDERRLAAAGVGLATPATRQAEHARTVLVVDDSITTRTLEKSILEAQGYRVMLAVDGLDALNMLRAGEAVVDLVVADIEMPRMDGFALLQAIKADSGLSSLPVVLMTSRNDPADIRRGMELGAEAYITKQDFDQRELLATIGRVI